MFTTAAGVHGVPLAEFALLGLLYFAKDMPGLTAGRRSGTGSGTRTGQLAGSRALLVGLGGIGRQVARLLAAAGVEVHRRRAARPQLRHAGVIVRYTDTAASRRCCPAWTRSSWPAR